MAGEAQSPDTPDDPAIPSPIVALATRIERAMRLSMGGMETRLRAEDFGRKATADVDAILRATERATVGLNDPRQAFVNVRITWLAGVLAGAMGEGKEPREGTNNDGRR
jgi:hypothetical protein